MEETKLQRLENTLEMHREWVKEMRNNRKYYVLGGIMIGVGVFGAILTLTGTI